MSNQKKFIAIHDRIHDIVKDELSSAQIVFNKNEVDKNEVSERSLGGQSSKGRTPNEKSDREE